MADKGDKVHRECPISKVVASPARAGSDFLTIVCCAPHR